MRTSPSRGLFLVLAATFAFAAAKKAATLKPQYLSYDAIQFVIQAMAPENGLPPDLQKLPPDQRRAEWPSWEASRDREVRARLEQGEEDSLANLMMFGTSFTHQPRITPQYMTQVAERNATNPSGANEVIQTLTARARDLASALSNPKGNERLEFMRRLVLRKGMDPDTAAGRGRLVQYLLADADRVRKEYESYAAELAAARRQHNATEELATRAVLFRHRGISLDTSLMPNYAIDDAIAALVRKNLLGPGSVRRVAIIGPGLDFVDKAEGYDFYPQQTIQPFAVIDSLLASGVSRDADIQVTTLDISARVNQHIAAARERARKGLGYTIQLAQDPAWHWTPVAQDYWEHFGSQISKPAQAVAIPPELGDLKIRAVTVAPRYVLDVTPVDLDVVYQNLPIPPAERYDLVIATNILVYYDIFEQELAMANVARMLKPGGFLLSNNILEELPGSPLKGVGYSQTAYSDRPGDGDQIFWYQAAPEPSAPKAPSAPK